VRTIYNDDDDVNSDSYGYYRNAKNENKKARNNDSDDAE